MQANLERTKADLTDRVTTSTAQRSDDGALWKDPRTNLTWTTKDNGVDITEQQGADYCHGLNLGGFQDWRLPTITELESIYDPQAIKAHQGLKGEIRLGTDNASVWSSSLVYRSGKLEAAYVIFAFGGRSFSPAGAYIGYRALCVRVPTH